MDGWTDGWVDDLRFYVLFNSISVISGRHLDDNERLCAMELRETHRTDQLSLQRLTCKQLYSHGAATRNWQTFLGDGSCLFLSRCFSRLTHYPKYVFSLNG